MLQTLHEIVLRKDKSRSKNPLRAVWCDTGDANRNKQQKSNCRCHYRKIHHQSREKAYDYSVSTQVLGTDP